MVQQKEDLTAYMQHAVAVSESSPVLLDRFLEDATEVDVDAVSDGNQVIVCGIMEHIEQAGVHSGDSACSLPPFTLDEAVQQVLRDQTQRLGKALKVIGLMNIQFAVRAGEVFVLEVNPRASRTAPFVSKAIGIPLAAIGGRCMVGLSFEAQGFTHAPTPNYYSVKEAVFPFVKFPGVDVLLGPEMKSTGEVMGVGRHFGQAFAKAALAAGEELPSRGRAFISVRDRDKPHAVSIGRDLLELGFELLATRGTARVLEENGIPCRTVNKVLEGRPHAVDLLKNEEIDFIVNTTEGKQAIADSYTIRRTALQHKVPYTTTMAGAKATVLAIREPHGDDVNCLQDLHREVQ